MKILTWNINGIRAIKEGLQKVVNALDVDILCLQETKVTRDQLDEPSAIVEGYNSYFSFSKVRSGYSGVATFVKDSATPVKAEEGLTGLLCSDRGNDIGCYGDQAQFTDEELQSLDNEGRTVITQHKINTAIGEELLTVINVYCPRADPEREDRKLYKMRFYELLEQRALALLKSGSHVIVLGDVNTSHKRIDCCDPADDFETRPTRKWLNKFLWDRENPDCQGCDAHKFVDTFRYYHPDQEKAYTCWSTVTGARATNYGTRIDYIFGNVDLVKGQFTDCVILPDVEGSDHCPVRASLKCTVIPAKKCPSLCTKYLPEFTGKQQKMSAFLKVKSKCEIGIVRESDVTSSQSQEEPPSSSQSKPFCSQEPASTKRNSALLSKQPSKKLKQTDKKPSGGTQGTILGFFGKTKVGEVPISKKIDTNQSQSQPAPVQTSLYFQVAQKSEDGFSERKDNKDVVNSWKSLLKGPPAAPACKGHGEPCVLRTVKKGDSLNKGRQFWVCQKPDGEKGNPLARCDHFEWVEKKKKK